MLKDGLGAVHHAPAADRAAADVQARPHKDRAVLVARRRHVAFACGQQGTSGPMLDTPGLRQSWDCTRRTHEGCLEDRPGAAAHSHRPSRCRARP